MPHSPPAFIRGRLACLSSSSPAISLPRPSVSLSCTSLLCLDLGERQAWISAVLWLTSLPGESCREGVFQGTAARIERLRYFWREEGLSDEATINELIERVSAEDQALADTDVLFAKLQRLRRLLPEVDVVKMAVKDPRVLQMDIAAATQNLVDLVQALPGQDISAAITGFPAALAMPDLRRRLDITLDRLHFWSHRSIVPMVLADNLWMLHRVPDYYSNATFDQLPMDIQNTMTIGGGGGGFHFKSWGGFRDNNTD
mmetsp:Transcript_7069/g.19969  ORF Transcript_7069/g.19969 Transcript_7069/m.19969 type:complete len:257 (-) Transcript_7069:446-1216(-)